MIKLLHAHTRTELLATSTTFSTKGWHICNKYLHVCNKYYLHARDLTHATKTISLCNIAEHICNMHHPSFAPRHNIYHNIILWDVNELSISPGTRTWNVWSQPTYILDALAKHPSDGENCIFEVPLQCYDELAHRETYVKTWSCDHL
jgi:hypothetical protein